MVEGALCSLIQDVSDFVIVRLEIVFVEAQSVRLKSTDFFAIINEVTSARSDGESIGVST